MKITYLLGFLWVVWACPCLGQDLRVSLQASLQNNYEYKGTDSEFDAQDLGLDLSYLATEAGSMFRDASIFYWGLGFGYSSMSVDRQAQGALDFVSAPDASLNLFRFNFLPGLNFGSFIFEIPLSFVLSQESSTQNDGDLKYGYGVGAKLYYRFYSKWSIGLGYEMLSFDSGKNASTGQSGSLGNPVSISQLLFIIGYSFSIGGDVSSGGGSFESY